MQEVTSISYLENETNELDITMSDDAQSANSRVREYFVLSKDRISQELLNGLASFINDMGDPALFETLKKSSQNAKHFIQLLPLYAETPEVSVDNEGEVVFEWISEKKNRLSIAIGEKKVLHYAAHCGQNRYHGRETLNGSLSSTLKLLLSEFSDEVC